MNDTEQRLWPFRSRTAIVAALLVLFGLLLMLVILRLTVAWPSPESESTVLFGIFLLSLVPILLMLADTLIERGGVVEYAGVKIDFSQVERVEKSGPTIPANIGMPGQVVMDSGTNAILDALRQAVTSESIIVDLEWGQAWWETRLLVLLAGAVRHGQPQIVIFVGTDGGTQRCFQGWATASKLLPHILAAHPKYSLIYHRALAAARAWEIVEPPSGPDVPWPPQLPWVQSSLATAHPTLAFDQTTRLPNPFLAEQLLASELATQVEQCGPPRTISLVRLADLFRSELHKEHIDESWPSERQLDVFFSNDTPYIAITEEGQYKALVSRLSALNVMMGTLVGRSGKG